MASNGNQTNHRRSRRVDPQRGAPNAGCVHRSIRPHERAACLDRDVPRGAHDERATRCLRHCGKSRQRSVSEGNEISGRQRSAHFVLRSIPSGEVVSRLRQYDFLAIPSQWMETGSLVALEAFAAGIPVIGWNLGGLTELVRHDVNGLLIEPNAFGRWGETLQRVANDAGLRARLDRVTTPASVAVAHEMLALYQSLLKLARRCRENQSPLVKLRKRSCHALPTSSTPIQQLIRRWNTVRECSPRRTGRCYSSARIPRRRIATLSAARQYYRSSTFRMPPWLATKIALYMVHDLGFRTDIVSGCSWVYASDPLACPTGLLLSLVPWIHVVYHEHDSPTPATLGSHGNTSLFMRIVLWTRRKLAHRTAVCVLPNERRAEQFTKDMGRGVKVVCVWNCPTKCEVGPSRPSLSGGNLWILYHGSLVPARLPTTVLHALGMLPERVKLRAIGYETVGHRGYVEELRALAGTLGISHRVEFIGTVPTRNELLARCREADIGLAFMPRTSHDINEQAMTGASNKPFDYLACGLALLVSDLPDWRALYVGNNLALPVNPEDAASIATALRWLLERPDELRTMGERGRQRILAEWNYEKQFRPVFELFNRKAT